MKLVNKSKITRNANSGKNNFTPVCNSLIQNNTLSLEARGLISYLLSLPSDWIIYKANILNTIGIGREKFNRIWKECIDAGYIEVEKIRQDNGTFTYDYIISDIINSTSYGLSVYGSTTCGKPVAIQSNNNKSNIIKDKFKKDSSSISVNTRTATATAFSKPISEYDDEVYKYKNNKKDSCNSGIISIETFNKYF